ncbi:hypothetical protein ABIA31_002081 [Catenulispora sp. MAP5-51]|uniref:UvrD-helicase domain-containing protein n=1 Tax=Catenulispora sp. MAP5-51 TaxID=3156298 RepID=UPI003515FF02
MTTPFAGSPVLTEEQRAVVELPADVKALVTAGAGSGKTHTLVRRLDALLASGQVSACEVLVLTFSRSAVRELSDRLAKSGDAARHVKARTFDSWALEILEGHDAVGDWKARSFEERIGAATDLIADGRADDWYEDDLLHVVIDEVQDLVGGRRELVQALLDRYDCGFTVVGDVAQAIYGFQVKRPEDRGTETGLFIKWLQNTFGDELDDDHRLTANFRAKSPEARVALPYGPQLEALVTTKRPGVQQEGRKVFDDLRATLADSFDFGNLAKPITHDALRAYDGTTAILCRTNGQALVISELLYGGGVPHRLQRSSRDRVVPAWLADMFKSDIGSVVTRSAFETMFPESVLAQVDIEHTWSYLARAAGTGGMRAVDLSKLRTVMAAQRMPDELTAQPWAQITVSSIHRAKGLEFDRVIVVRPEASRVLGETDILEEARLLYVAMTRARDELMRSAVPETLRLRVCQPINRWARYGLQDYQRFGLAIDGGDVHTADPAGTYGFEADPLRLQDLLRHEVCAGDSVTIERSEHDPGGPGLPPGYGIFHRGRQIGMASNAFREDLNRYMKRWPRSVVETWPRTISGVRIEAVETVVGSEASGRLAGIGEYGVWLAPRLVGLSNFTYDTKPKQGLDNV